MRTIFEKYGSVIALSFVALMTAIMLAHPIIAASSMTTWDYNEGWNAFQAERAFNNGPLYPKITALTSNNYPPLSFYIVGGLGYVIGDNIFAGRIIALVGLFSVGLSVGIIVYLMGGFIVVASFTGLLLVAYMAAYHDSYVGMNDPQWLAHAIMMIGLIVFLHRRETRSRLLLSMLLMLGAGMMKHSLIPLPLAVTVWLFMHDRRNFYFWIISSSLSFTGCMVIFYLAYGPEFFESVFAAPRIYDFWRIPGKTKWLMPLFLFIGIAIAFVVVDRAKSHTQLVGLYILFSGIWGAFILGGEGVDRNAIFDLIIAVTAATGLAVQYVLQRVDRKLSRRSVEVTALLILSLPLLVIVPSRAGTLKTFIGTIKEQEALTVMDVAFIAAQDGPVMCENLALCYWAGKNFEVDVFNLGQKLKTGVLPENDYIERLDDKYFALIQTDNRKGIIWKMPKSVRAHIRANYKLRRPPRKHGAFLVPRGPE